MWGNTSTYQENAPDIPGLSHQNNISVSKWKMCTFIEQKFINIEKLKQKF
jgi:hypothetical protein